MQAVATEGMKKDELALRNGLITNNFSGFSGG